MTSPRFNTISNPTVTIYWNSVRTSCMHSVARPPLRLLDANYFYVLFRLSYCFLFERAKPAKQPLITMPKRRRAERDDSDSDYEEEQGAADADNSSDDVDNAYHGKRAPTTAGDDSQTADWERLPRDNSDRLTEYGGYAHTIDSKMKISMANRGNLPWNKVRPFCLSSSTPALPANCH